MPDCTPDWIRPLRGKELQETLDSVAEAAPIVARNIQNQQQPKTHAEGEAWGICATACLFLAATIQKMLENEQAGLPLEGGEIKAEGKKP